MADPNVGSFTPINIWGMLRDLINNGCPILTISGAPTSGTSGSFVGQAGKAALLIDYTNGVVYFNIGTSASPTWVTLGVGSQPVTIAALTANGAIAVSSRTYVITKAGVLADTLAAPAASPGGDGVIITVSSDTANAHTITFTGSTLDSGSAAALTATFNALKGASLTVMSYNGRWKVISANGVSFT